MKVCLSNNTFRAFEKVFRDFFKDHEILLLDQLGNLIEGEGKPEVVFASYEIMFKCLNDQDYRKKIFSLVDGCEFIQGSWAGIESKVTQDLINRTKYFSHGGGVHAITLATYVFAQMLRHVKGIDAHIELQKKKEWKQILLPGELTDMIIGIAGFGGIGKEIARLAKAFRMKVYATKRNPVSSDNLDRLFKPSDLEEMIKECDFVVNCLPVTQETEKVFSLNQFKAMRESAMFINVGRGETVQEQDLFTALDSGEIACAALDTTDPEPLAQDSPLWELKNCFITPHDSAWGPRAPERAVNLFLENMKRYLSNKKILNLVE